MAPIIFVICLAGAVSSAVHSTRASDQASVAFCGLFLLSALLSLAETFRLY